VTEPLGAVARTALPLRSLRPSCFLLLPQLCETGMDRGRRLGHFFVV
jgi:hypothetical protein